MYEIYHKKLKHRSNPRLGLLHSNILRLIIEITANFALALSDLLNVWERIWLSEF